MDDRNSTGEASSSILIQCPSPGLATKAEEVCLTITATVLLPPQAGNHEVFKFNLKCCRTQGSCVPAAWYPGALLDALISLRRGGGVIFSLLGVYLL